MPEEYYAEKGIQYKETRKYQFTSLDELKMVGCQVIPSCWWGHKIVPFLSQALIMS